MDAIATVALVIFLLAAILAVVSLIKPGAAFFLKDKTRKKAFFSYLGIAFLGLVVIGIAAPKVEKKPEGAKSTNQQSSVGDKKEATVSGEQAAKAELRTLYLEFEGFIKSGDIQKESWLDTAKRRVWTERLEKICGGSLFTPDLKKSGCDIASNLFTMSSKLNMNAGRFSEFMEDDLKIVVNALKTDPSDNIGADLLQVAAQNVATATPEEKAAVQQERKMQQWERDKPRLEAAIKKLDKDITNVGFFYLDGRTRIDISYKQDWLFKPFFTIGEKAKGILQKMVEKGLVEDATDVACYVSVPTKDRYGSESTGVALGLTWDGVTLKKINWKNIFGPQFLNLCTQVEVKPLMRDVFTKFAADADNQKEYRDFIITALKERGQ